MLNNIVEPESSVTMLNNIVDLDRANLIILHFS